MPNFNNGAYISKAIQSILDQSFTNFEFIIIDNNSTDNSLKIIEDFASSDSRIIIMNIEKRGISNLLNLGLKRSKYEYIARMDSDDIALSNRLQIQLNYMKSRPEIAVLGSPTLIIDENDKFQFISDHPVDEEKLNERIQQENAISHPTVLFRKNTILKAGGYNPQAIHAEDYDLWLRVMKLGKLQNLSTPVLKYRIHENASGFKQLLNQRISAFVSQQIHLFDREIIGKNVTKKEYSLDYLKNNIYQPIGLEKFSLELNRLLYKYYSKPRVGSEKLVLEVEEYLKSIS